VAEPLQEVEQVHAWRPRRSAYGELVQWDTSEHDWLEGRGERVRYLVRLIDDATSRSRGRFVWHDGTRENMGILWSIWNGTAGWWMPTRTERRCSRYRPEKAKARHSRRQADRVTQIGRALRELGIGWIPAYSPHAKGRVERGFQTDQDRLIKLLRLARVTTMQAANAFLENEYWSEWNDKFAKPLQGITDLHRPLTPQIDLPVILSHVEHRVITSDLTISFAVTRYRIVKARCPARNEGPATASRTAARWQPESPFSRPIRGVGRMQR
jgi:hypothetical protein